MRLNLEFAEVYACMMMLRRIGYFVLVSVPSGKFDGRIDQMVVYIINWMSNVAVMEITTI